MSVYMIIDVDIQDAEKYQQYIDHVFPIVAKYGGRYHVRGGTLRSLGTWKPDRIVVIEFPTDAHIQKWLTSPEYREVAPLREESAVARAIIVNGYKEE
jgi:uncharacterized protein (DUF1330 family)